MESVLTSLPVVKPVWNFRYSFPNVFMRSFMYGMVGSLAMFITSWDKADRMKDIYLDKNREYGDTYDFIVVGGGTAGSIVANRLSSEYKVLLLEAGGDPHPFQSIPFLANFMTNYPELDWMHKTVKQKHAFFGSEQNRATISQGKALGGTSNLDYLMYLRGSSQDYDNWAKITGDHSWGYSNVMKYFMKHEKYEGPWNESRNKKMHGQEGEMRIALPHHEGLSKRFVRAGNEMGYPHVDLNAIYTEGFDMMNSPTKLGYRDTAYKSFLKRAGKDRWNLVVQKYAHVNKILTRGDDNEAYAVEYDRHGKTRHAYARKEIILSAGAIQTPKILMHSGIGPSDHLHSVGIATKVHLPSVGQNLQDHIGIYLGPFFTTPKSTLLLDRDLTASSLLSYAMSQGPLTSTGYEASAMLSSSSSISTSTSNPHWPNIQLTMYGLALHSTSDEDFSHAHGIKRSLMKSYYLGSKDKDSFSIVVSLARPKSAGEVKLQDNNPYTPPLIDPKYLEQIEDVGVLVDGIKKSMRMVENTLSFRQINAQFTNRSVEGCQKYKLKSDEYWACFLRVMSTSMGDVAGTASIGRVVDTELKVLGVNRLRVIDASVMPSIVSGGTSAATMMIGEKGAELILGLWGRKDNKEKYMSEAKDVRKILKQASSKLKQVDGAKLFLSSIKDTDSFKGLSPLDLAKGEQKNIVQGIFAPLRPFFNFGGKNATTTEKTTTPTHSNPFKLIGAMFRNSFTGSTAQPTPKQKPTTPQPPKLPLFHFKTQSTTPHIVETTTDQNLEELFGPQPTQKPYQEFQPPLGYLTYPFEEIILKPNDEPKTGYVLTPKSIIQSLQGQGQGHEQVQGQVKGQPQIQVQPSVPPHDNMEIIKSQETFSFSTKTPIEFDHHPTQSTFTGSVDSILSQFGSFSTSGSGSTSSFSKTLPILWSKDKNPKQFHFNYNNQQPQQIDQNQGDSYSSNSEVHPSVINFQGQRNSRSKGVSSIFGAQSPEFKLHVAKFIKLNDSLTQQEDFEEVTTSRTLKSETTTKSPLEILMQAPLIGLQAVATPLKMVSKALEGFELKKIPQIHEIPKISFPSILRPQTQKPFLSMINYKNLNPLLEGFMKSMTSFVKPSPPVPLQSSISPTKNPKDLKSFKGFKDSLSFNGLGSQVQKIIRPEVQSSPVSITVPTAIPIVPVMTPPPPPPASPIFTTTTTTTNGNYGVHTTQQNNTYRYPELIANQTPAQLIRGEEAPQIPLDYEFIDVEAHTTPTSPISQGNYQNYQYYPSIPMTNPISPDLTNYKIIYTNPQENLNKSPYEYDLASNVQGILQKSNQSPQSYNSYNPYISTQNIPSLQSFSSIYTIEDPKNFEEEVDKLIQGQNFPQDSQVYVLVPNQNQNSQVSGDNFKEVLVASQSSQNPLNDPNSQSPKIPHIPQNLKNVQTISDNKKVAFSQIVHDIMAEHRKSKDKQGLYTNPNSGPTGSPIINNSLNSLPFSQGIQKPMTIADFKALWPTESTKLGSRKKDALSFKIKILNQ